MVKEVPADNILNYDETNLADDPAQEKLERNIVSM